MGIPSSSRAFVLVQNDFFGGPACQPPTWTAPWEKSGTNPWAISPLHFGHCICSLLIIYKYTSRRTQTHYNCALHLEPPLPSRTTLVTQAGPVMSDGHPPDTHRCVRALARCRRCHGISDSEATGHGSFGTGRHSCRLSSPMATPLWLPNCQGALPGHP